MGKIIRTFDEVVDGNYKRLSMGIRPSGRIHYGSLLTLMNAFCYMGGAEDSQFEVQIMDLDFDLNRGNVFVPYMRRQGPPGSNMSAREYMAKELDDLFGVLANHFDIDMKERVSVTYFSEFLHEPQALDFFTDILSNTEKATKLMSALFDGRSKAKIPVSGICSSCHTSSNTFANGTNLLQRRDRWIESLRKIETGEIAVPDKEAVMASKERRLEKFQSDIYRWCGGNEEDARFLFKSTCHNKECHVETYIVDIRQPGSYNVHYLVDPIRDALVTETRQRNDLHIFGGDYGELSGVKKIMKARRIQMAMEEIGLEPAACYVGPILLYNGFKMAKSSVSMSVGDVEEGFLNYHIDKLRAAVLQSPNAINFRTIRDQ